MIKYTTQFIDADDLDAVTSTLSSEYLTQGPNVCQFSHHLSKYCGADFAVTFNSATTALYSAYRALGIRKNKRVWTSAITFAATSNAALILGAEIKFIDISLENFNIDLEILEYELQKAYKTRELPDVVVPVHLGGAAVDMAKLKLLSEEFGFKILEDASHAIGASYMGEKIGSCMYSDACVFSFHALKNMTTCEGGAVLTNSKQLADSCWLDVSHGITSDPARMIKSCDDEIWNYQQIDIGLNFRLSEVQCALGLSQLKKLDVFNNRRRDIAEIYVQQLKHEKNIYIQKVDKFCESSFHLFPILIEENPNFNRNNIYHNLRKKDIMVNIHYIPVYLHPYYQKLGFKRGQCPNAELYFKRALSLPIHPGLTDDNVNYVVNCLRSEL